MAVRTVHDCRQPSSRSGSLQPLPFVSRNCWVWLGYPSAYPQQWRLSYDSPSQKGNFRGFLKSKNIQAPYACPSCKDGGICRIYSVTLLMHFCCKYILLVCSFLWLTMLQGSHNKNIWTSIIAKQHLTRFLLRKAKKGTTEKEIDVARRP